MSGDAHWRKPPLTDKPPSLLALQDDLNDRPPFTFQSANGESRQLEQQSLMDNMKAKNEMPVLPESG